MQQIQQHWLAGGAGGAEIAMGQSLQIVPELHRQRAIQAKLLFYLLIGGSAGVIADDL
ncbi:hypothetical protein D3C78_1482280 [compost metagenome]